MKTSQIPYRMQRIIARISNPTAFAPRNQRRQRENQRHQCGELARHGADFPSGGKCHASMPGMAQAAGPTRGNGGRRRRPSASLPAFAEAAGSCLFRPRRHVTPVACPDVLPPRRSFLINFLQMVFFDNSLHMWFFSSKIPCHVAVRIWGCSFFPQLGESEKDHLCGAFTRATVLPSRPLHDPSSGSCLRLHYGLI
jgi:hypothetical protein